MRFSRQGELYDAESCKNRDRAEQRHWAGNAQGMGGEMLGYSRSHPAADRIRTSTQVCPGSFVTLIIPLYFSAVYRILALSFLSETLLLRVESERRCELGHLRAPRWTWLSWELRRAHLR